MDTEVIKDKYEPRIRGLLIRIASERGADYTWDGEVFEMYDDEYRWGTVLEPTDPKREPVSVDFTIVESSVRDGSEDGIAFTLDMVEAGGKVLGGMSPYNYSPELWIPLQDAEGIEARFKIFEDADFTEIPKLLHR